MSWNDGLADPALSIAGSEELVSRVVAGPGTGKSFTLKRKVQRLLETGVPPRKIFVSTFTRTAAADLQKDLQGLGVEGADKIDARTLHSHAYRLLLQEEVLTETQRVPRPLLPFEERFLVRDLIYSCKDLGFSGIKGIKAQLSGFSAAWARLQHEAPGWAANGVDKEFEMRLKDWLRFHKCMLVGEIIPEALRYLRNNPISEHRNQYEHVFVDEYQDLNKAEQTLVDLISCKHLTIIGDEDQSIYSFKYAHPSGIAEFSHDHPKVFEGSLDECRRCPHLVVDVANSLISFNRSRSKRLLLKHPGREKCDFTICQWQDPTSEQEGISRFLIRGIQRGEFSPGDILILSPRRPLAQKIKARLVAEGVEAHSFFTDEICAGLPEKEKENGVQKALTILTLLADPEDRVALRSWIGFDSSSLRSSGWHKIMARVREEDVAPRSLLERLQRGELKQPYTTEIGKRFSSLLKLEAEYAGKSGEDLFNGLFGAIGDEKDTLRAVLAPNLDATYTADKMIKDLRQAISSPELPQKADYVRLMSLHKSKGLTAKVVVVVGCAEGILPFLNSEAEGEALDRSMEEARRLFYVAITRTTQTLVLSSFRRINKSMALQMNISSPRTRGSHLIFSPSRFLSELGPKAPCTVTGEQFLAARSIT